MIAIFSLLRYSQKGSNSMRNIYLLEFAITNLFAFYTIINIIDFVDKTIHHKKREKSRIVSRKIFLYLSIFSLLLTIIFSAPVQEIIKLDSIYFKPPGDYCYRINIYDYKTKNEYTVPARIVISMTSEDSGDFYGESRTKSFIHYNLEDVYLPTETLFFFEDIDVNKPINLYDYENSKKWECTLLNERAYYSKLKFNNGITAFNIIIDILNFLLFSSYIVIYFIENGKTKSSGNSF